MDKRPRLEQIFQRLTRTHFACASACIKMNSHFRANALCSLAKLSCKIYHGEDILELSLIMPPYSLSTICEKWTWKLLSRVQLCDPMDYTVHGILQTRILVWAAFPFSRNSSQSRDWTQVSHIAGGFFTSRATGKPQSYLFLLSCTICTYQENKSKFLGVSVLGMISHAH